MSCIHNRHDDQVYTVDDATYVPSGAVAMTTHYLPFAILTTILKLTIQRIPPLPLNSYNCNKQHHLEWWSIKLLNLIKMATDASGQQQPLLEKGWLYRYQLSTVSNLANISVSYTGLL